MWTDLSKKLSYLSREDRKFVKNAFDLALKAHRGQKRSSGVPYFFHPFKVALFLAEHKLEKEIIAAGLLHDVCEETNITLENLKKEFNEEVTLLVDGVSAIGKIQNQASFNFKNQNEKRQTLKLQKLILASAKDIRVIFIRVLDRKHNMEDLEVFSRKKQIRKAKETLQIYAPLAKKIGMSQLGSELEDRAFLYLYPNLYKKIKILREKNLPGTLYLIGTVKQKIIKEAKKRKIKVLEINHRTKTLYSLYKKLKHHDISRVYDLVALRLIVRSKKECYEILGLVHGLYKPMIGRIKDFIAHPKYNGYQSLHTTVFIKGEKPLEIQIRTLKMHHHAEFGLAAHWIYKEEYSKKDIIEWIKTLNLALTKNYNLEGFFKNQIFIFTPKGKVIELPSGSTALDFAFAVHTEIGEKTKMVLVDGQIQPLDYRLKNGQVVEIKTAKLPQVSSLWLEKIKTAEARHKIHSYLRNQNKDQKIKKAKDEFFKKMTFFGQKITEWQKHLPLILNKFNFKSEEDLFLHLHDGEIKIESILNFIIPQKQVQKKTTAQRTNGTSILVAGERGLKIKIASCCQPKPNQAILGYISKENQASIHRKNCPLVSNFDKSRIIPAWWEGEKMEFEITALDRPGLLRDITSVFAQKNINILAIQSDNRDDDSTKIKVAFEKPIMLNYMGIVKNLENIFGVKKVILPQ